VYNLKLESGAVNNPTWFISKNDFLGSDALDDIQETITSLQVKQDSIEASVNDTSLKITNGDITLNGNTEIKGSLVLNANIIEDETGEHEDDSIGFVLHDANYNNGTCQIIPKSIGEYGEYQKTTSITLDKEINHDVAITLNAQDSTSKTFMHETTIALGYVDKDENIILKNSQLNAISDLTSLHTIIATCRSVLVKYELLDMNGNVVKTATCDKLDTSSFINHVSTGQEYYVRVTMSGIIDAYINDDTTFKGVYNSIINVQLKFKYILPTTTSMLIGYDGIAINFGDTNHVYIGKDKCVFKYGNYGIEISKDGIKYNEEIK
jgi:hypothetical protein